MTSTSISRSAGGCSWPGCVAIMRLARFGRKRFISKLSGVASSPGRQALLRAIGRSAESCWAVTAHYCLDLPHTAEKTKLLSTTNLASRTNASGLAPCGRPSLQVPSGPSVALRRHCLEFGEVMSPGWALPSETASLRGKPLPLAVSVLVSVRLGSRCVWLLGAAEEESHERRMDTGDFLGAARRCSMLPSDDL